MHQSRSRGAHHEPLIAQPLAQRWKGLLTVVGYLDPALRAWVAAQVDVPAVLARRPQQGPPPLPH